MQELLPQRKRRKLKPSVKRSELKLKLLNRPIKKLKKLRNALRERLEVRLSQWMKSYQPAPKMSIAVTKRRHQANHAKTREQPRKWSTRRKREMRKTLASK